VIRRPAVEDAEAVTDDVERPVAIQQTPSAVAADDGPEAEIAVAKIALVVGYLFGKRTCFE